MTEAEAVASLRACGLENPVREARLLVRIAGQGGLADAVARRAQGEPMSHISGRRAFWADEFHVNSDVLDPRPDTETLVEQALSVRFQTVLDLGTGSGCILLSLLGARPTATGLGVDISAPALEIARKNGAALKLTKRARFQCSDWFDRISGQFDLIVSNPPYIDAETYETLDRGMRAFEPKIALTPGGDGLDAYRIIADQARDYMTRDGMLALEIGYDQGEAVPALLRARHWQNITCHQDLNGHPRVITAKPHV